MAVYTSVSAEDLVPFLQQYDIGAPISHEGIRQGVENSNYHLYTERGHFILTLFEKRVKETDLPYFFAFTDHLAGAGVRCPKAVPDRKGSILNKLRGRPTAIITFLEGSGITTADVTDDYCAQLGSCVARMHASALNFKGQRANALSIAGWKELQEKIEDKADSVEDGLAALIKSEIAYLEHAWPQGLPRTSIHGDIFPDNVFFKDGKLYGVVDFYFSCTDFVAYDLAIAINAWCFDTDHRFVSSRYKALMNAYENKRALSAEENAAMPVLCRGAAIRFLMTRLHDWVFHDPKNYVKPKDPKEYIKKLRFFQERFAG